MVRVLLVDDDAKVRAALRIMLEDEGFEVAEAGDGDQALRAIRRQGADVILCDVCMPKRGGLDLLRDLRPEKSGIRVVAMSGGGDYHGTVNLLPLATALGAQAVLHKPCSQHELRAALDRALLARAVEEPREEDDPKPRSCASRSAGCRP